jgi:flavin-dependent dehydrogenase
VGGNARESGYLGKNILAFSVPLQHRPVEIVTVVVAGGGLAGAAAATALAQAGIDVTVVERNAGPVDKICGEFLSAEALNYLTQLGLNVEALGGHTITHVRLVRGATATTAALPFRGIGLSRKILDEALLTQAAACGAKVQRGQTFRPDDHKHSDLFLATGKHELHGHKRDNNPPDLVGFKMYFGLTPAQEAALAHHVELTMFPGGYGGLQLVENHRANFCLLVSSERLKRVGGKWPDLLADLCAESPHLAARLAGATNLLAAPLTIARVPYGFIHRARNEDRCFRLGDQAGVIQSFTGDGMSIALHSAALAARYYLTGESSAAYHRKLARDISGQIKRASALYSMINAPAVQPILFAIARACPASLAIAARLTRVPTKSLVSPVNLQNQQDQDHQQREAETAAII